MSYSIEKADFDKHKSCLRELSQRKFEVVPSERFGWIYENNPVGQPVVFLVKYCEPAGTCAILIQATVTADSLAFLADPFVELYCKIMSSRFTRGYQSTLIDDFDTSFNAFLQNRAKHLSLAGQRTVAFLNWRLKDSPYGDNQAVVLKKDKAIYGYISYCVRDNRCDIEDFAFDENAKSLKALLAVFTVLQLKKRIEVISINLAGQKTLVDEFAKAEFSIRGKENQFMIYTAPEDLKQMLLSPAEMGYLTSADNDI